MSQYSFPRQIALALALVLTTGGVLHVLTAGAAAFAAGEQVMSISSDPPGAAVYVDGTYSGQTPVMVRSLAPGDHRVRLVRTGYLENSRLVAVGGSRPASLLIRLTARAGAALGSPGQTMALRIVVLEGEGGVNIIDKMTAVQPVVQVVDRNNLPVSGATVLFAIGGRAARFANGAQQVSVTTDATGRAVAMGLNPLGRGSLQIQVRATFQGQSATASISQTNFATVQAAAQAGKVAGAGGQAGGSAAGGGTATGGTAGGTAAGGSAAGGAAAGASTAAVAGGLSATAIGGIVAGAVAGTAVAVKAASGSSSTPSACDSGCTLSSTTITSPSQGGMLTVNVTAPGGRTWTAASNASFITVTSGASGTGNGVVTLSVAANSGAQRTGTVSIAEHALTVTQSESNVLTGTWSGTVTSVKTGSSVVTVPVSIPFVQSGDRLTGSAEDNGGLASFALTLTNQVGTLLTFGGTVALGAVPGDPCSGASFVGSMAADTATNRMSGSFSGSNPGCEAQTVSFDLHRP